MLSKPAEIDGECKPKSDCRVAHMTESIQDQESWRGFAEANDTTTHPGGRYTCRRQGGSQEVL